MKGLFSTINLNESPKDSPESSGSVGGEVPMMIDGKVMGAFEEGGFVGAGWQQDFNTLGLNVQGGGQVMVDHVPGWGSGHDVERENVGHGAPPWGFGR